MGVGFYHHLILRLQLEYGLDLAGIIDFAYPGRKNDHSDVSSLLFFSLKLKMAKNNFKSISKQIGRSTPPKLPSEEAKQCVIRTIHRSLICLGDLARYKLDLEPNWDPQIAARYYKMAITLDPTIGMPHNQLGTVSGNKNYGIDAVYHYMRCILCPESFEGAEGNLKRIISTHFYTGKEKLPSQRCAARLFTLLQKWNNDSGNIDRINEDCQNLLIDIENCLSMKKIQSININSAKEAHTIDEYLQIFKPEPVSYLTDDVMFKMVAICLMSISKLQTKQSPQVQGVIAFILSLLSQLIQVTIDSLQDAIIELSLVNGKDDNFVIEDESTSIIEGENSNCDIIDAKKHINENIQNGHITNGCAKKPRNKAKKNLLIKLRRRRKRINSSDSDGSDIDGQHFGSSSDDLNSDISETEEEDMLSEGQDGLSDDLTDDETININGIDEKKINGHEITGINETKIENKLIDENLEHKIDAAESLPNCVDIQINKIGINPSLGHIAQLKKQNLVITDLFEIISKEGLLYSIKICFDWLKSNPDIIRMVATSSRTLLHRMATLLNLMNIDSEALLAKWDRESTFLINKEKVKEHAIVIPLPEDIDLRGLNVLQNAHENLDWQILKNFNMRKQEEILLRILKLMEFGNYLCNIQDSPMKFDDSQNLYTVTESKETSSPIIIKDEKFEEKVGNLEHPRGKLMRHMGKLWLKAEVRALESRLKSKLMSPYLVPDHEALAKHTPALKRLVYAKKFIVVIPSIGKP